MAVINQSASSGDTPFDTETIVQSYIDSVTKLVVRSPLSYIYTALPYTQNQYMIMNARFTGEFGFNIPDGHDLINLNSDNYYTPIFPSPVMDEVDKLQLDDPKFVLDSFFSGDAELELGVDVIAQWDFTDLANRELTIDTSIEGPHILIYHTHNQEVYIDEDWREYETGGVIAVGNALTQELENRFGVEVLHVTDSFYLDGSRSVDGAYERMEAVIAPIIENNPSIQLVIDIHRDALSAGAYLAGEVDGEPAAKLMFVNGLTQWRNLAGELVYMNNLVNEYVEDNLTVSIQAQIAALTYYPDIMRRIYLKPYRYGLHMHPNTLVVEVGASTNTLEEALVSVAPLADIIGIVFNLY